MLTSAHRNTSRTRSSLCLVCHTLLLTEHGHRAVPGHQARPPRHVPRGPGLRHLVLPLRQHLHDEQLQHERSVEPSGAVVSRQRNVPQAGLKVRRVLKAGLNGSQTRPERVPAQADPV